VVHVLKQVKSRFSQFFKLRLDQIYKDVDRREARNGITFVKHNSLFDVGISVLACGVVVDELSIQVVEVELDLGTP
jgi:hypothetical protein